MGKALYFCGKTLESMARSPWLSAATVGMLAVIFLMFNGFALLAFNVGDMAERWIGQVRMTVFLHPKVSPDAARKLGLGLKEREEVADAVYVDEDGARERFLSAFPGDAAVFDGLQKNPLPASIEVELSPEAMDPAMWKDDLTGIANRLGLEAELSKWWEDDPQRELPLNAAMIDIDHFSQINEQHGHTTGNEILRAVAQLLNAEIGSRGTAGRFCGQQFLLLLPNADARGATNLTEKIRQTLEIAHFQRQDLDIQVTVSCGVSKSTPEDTSDTLFARAEATLQEAKRYGDNRTFLREGNYPTPVVPPSFALEEKTISL